MSTTDTVLAIILTSLLSIFFIMLIAVVVSVLKLLSNIKRVVARAESVIDSVESVTEVMKDTNGKMAMFKLVRNIMKLVQRNRKWSGAAETG